MRFRKINNCRLVRLIRCFSKNSTLCNQTDLGEIWFNKITRQNCVTQHNQHVKSKRGLISKCWMCLLQNRCIKEDMGAGLFLRRTRLYCFIYSFSPAWHLATEQTKREKFSHQKSVLFYCSTSNTNTLETSYEGWKINDYNKRIML